MSLETNDESMKSGSDNGALGRLLDRPIPPERLEEAASEASLAAGRDDRGRVGIVLFGLAEETLALPAMLVRRVTTLARPIRIPHRSSAILRGVCNVRGELILCADLRRLLGMPARDDSGATEDGSDSRRTMVIGPRGATWAFEVDSLVGVSRVDLSMLALAPLTVEHSLGAFVTGLIEIEGRRIAVLDGDQVLAGFKAALT